MLADDLETWASSDDDDLRADDCASAERDNESDENQLSSIGDFEVTLGWETLEPPTETSHEWQLMQNTYKWIK